MGVKCNLKTLSIRHQRSFFNLFFQHKLHFTNFSQLTFQCHATLDCLLLSRTLRHLYCLRMLVALSHRFVGICEKQGLNASSFRPSQLTFRPDLLDIRVSQGSLDRHKHLSQVLEQILWVKRVAAQHRFKLRVPIHQVMMSFQVAKVVIDSIVDECNLDLASGAWLLQTQQVCKVIIDQVLGRRERAYMAVLVCVWVRRQAKRWSIGKCLGAWYKLLSFLLLCSLQKLLCLELLH